MTDLFGDKDGGSNAGLDQRLLLNQTMTALLLGISTQAFSKWAVPPRLRRGREALYYWPDVLAERDARYYPEPEEEPEGQLDLEQERARLAKEQADKTALENAVTRTELTYVDMVAETWGRLIGAARERMLSVPNAIAATAPPAVRAKIVDQAERVVREALQELAEFDPGPREPES